MINTSFATGNIKKAISKTPFNPLKKALSEMNGYMVGLHDFKREIVHLFNFSSAEEKNTIISTIQSLAKKLKKYNCKIEVLPKTKNGEIPAFPDDIFATRDFYLVEKSYPECDLKRYIHLYCSKKSYLQIEDLKALDESIVPTLRWSTTGLDLKIYRKKLEKRGEILSSPDNYFYTQSAKEGWRKQWESIAKGIGDRITKKETPSAVKIPKIPADTSNPTATHTPKAALPTQKIVTPAVKQTAQPSYPMSIPKEIYEICKKVREKSAFAKYTKKLEELRKEFPNCKLEHKGNGTDTALYITDSKGVSKEVLPYKADFSKDIKHLVINLEKIIAERRQKTMDLIMGSYCPQLTYNPKATKLYPNMAVNLTSQEATIANNAYEKKLLKSLFTENPYTKQIQYYPDIQLTVEGLSVQKVKETLEGFTVGNFRKTATPKTPLLEYKKPATIWQKVKSFISNLINKD